MGWNYRVMKHSEKDESTGKVETWFGIHEVYYRSDDVDDLAVGADETGYTAEPVRVIADEVDDLRRMLTRMLESLDKPVLKYENSPT